MSTTLLPPPSRSRAHRTICDAATLRIPRDANTLAGFRRWVLSDDFPEKQPVMYLHGEIFLDMPKENIFTHAAVKTPVALTVGGLFRELDLGHFYINGVLVTNVDAAISNNPDMVGVLWESLDNGKVRYNTNAKNQAMEVEGSPDWLLEIVSDGSVEKDKVALRAAYHEAGVREYWIIDARGDEIEFQILNWRKSGYVTAKNKAGWLHSRILNRDFHLTREPDQHGGWRYELAVKG